MLYFFIADQIARCPANAIQMGWATLAIWIAIKKILKSIVKTTILINLFIDFFEGSVQW